MGWERGNRDQRARGVGWDIMWVAFSMTGQYSELDLPAGWLSYFLGAHVRLAAYAERDWSSSKQYDNNYLHMNYTYIDLHGLYPYTCLPYILES